jgi:hypothetical protein
MFKSTILPLTLMLLAIVAIASTLTGVYLWDFSQDCGTQGGNFSVEGGTAWCRF